MRDNALQSPLSLTVANVYVTLATGLILSSLEELMAYPGDNELDSVITYHVFRPSTQLHWIQERRFVHIGTREEILFRVQGLAGADQGWSNVFRYGLAQDVAKAFCGAVGGVSVLQEPPEESFLGLNAYFASLCRHFKCSFYRAVLQLAQRIMHPSELRRTYYKNSNVTATKIKGTATSQTKWPAGAVEFVFYQHLPPATALLPPTSSTHPPRFPPFF